ncbi:uncharacterized protein PHALS_13973 [Plasmopara halstedii]|uniref:Uncharacterized protein n=1 Tax=Plasmopara halstedii TaxID=4781 RepID=A0A0P1AR19_PLAHL|nr:uncharacterized protein PHALS_13973 [Plasmopara halstedii]CEG43676.1 hypothetical protein PHALS_13973 [Plasmopara halstedii]|eukprot:XP_024580045.1 hypothetical protein PHALS_13973 [Plasmopara halstedii]
MYAIEDDFSAIFFLRFTYNVRRLRVCKYLIKRNLLLGEGIQLLEAQRNFTIASITFYLRRQRSQTTDLRVLEKGGVYDADRLLI